MEDMGRYHMFKTEREVTDPSIMEDLLGKCRWMSIAMSGPDGPYIVTLSYGYDKDRRALYFHTAKSGLKLELLKIDPKVCGSVIEDLGYQHGSCSHAYRSLVTFGKISFVDDEEEIAHAFKVLVEHQELGNMTAKRKYLEDPGSFGSAQVLRFDMETMRCKQGGP
jgi:nitroimidazol reductase NimA-like FMN-containing flavoprotein (pyridoxamine 5'-phosphate oxidase superfamily)